MARNNSTAAAAIGRIPQSRVVTTASASAVADTRMRTPARPIRALAETPHPQCRCKHGEPALKRPPGHRDEFRIERAVALERSTPGRVLAELELLDRLDDHGAST